MDSACNVMTRCFFLQPWTKGESKNLNLNLKDSRVLGLYTLYGWLFLPVLCNFLRFLGTMGFGQDKSVGKLRFPAGHHTTLCEFSFLRRTVSHTHSCTRETLLSCECPSCLVIFSSKFTWKWAGWRFSSDQMPHSWLAILWDFACRLSVSYEPSSWQSIFYSWLCI